MPAGQGWRRPEVVTPLADRLISGLHPGSYGDRVVLDVGDIGELMQKGQKGVVAC
jgi:hypothetical protein